MSTHCRTCKLMHMVFLLIVFACRTPHADDLFVFCTIDVNSVESCAYPFEVDTAAAPQLIDIGGESVLFSAQIILTQDETFIAQLSSGNLGKASRKAVEPREQALFVRHCDERVFHIMQQHFLRQGLPLQFVAEKNCEPNPNSLRFDSIIQWYDQVYLEANKVSIHLGKIKLIAERILGVDTPADEADIRQIFIEAVNQELIIIVPFDEHEMDKSFENHLQSYITSALFDRRIEITTGSQNEEIHFALKDSEMSEDFMVTIESGSSVRVDRYAVGTADLLIF